MKILLVIIALFVASPMAVIAQTCSKQSPAHTVALVELYTSEGCSSCPPADHAVSGLQKAADTDMVAPLSLHVDYWDYIGWVDRFANPDFAQRQRWLAAIGNTHAVYTPEIFMNGHELRNWPRDLVVSIADINQQPAKAKIGISLGNVNAGKLPVNIRIHVAASAKLFIGLYENGLSSNIKAGENNGVTLRHDYVVRDWLGPITLPASGNNGNMHIMKMLAVPSISNSRQLGVAAFVQGDSGEILQALALPLCGT